MEETKTTLQKIVEQKADQILGAIEEAIADGAKIEGASASQITIDKIFLQKNYDNRIAIVLYFDSEKIAKLFKDNLVELKMLAERKRRELEELENQIKEREKE